MGACDALDAAVGASEKNGGGAIIRSALDTDHRTLWPDRASAGGQCRGDEGDVGAAFVAERTAVIAGAAVIAGRTAIPRQRQRGAAISLPAEAERLGAGAERFRGIGQRVWRQRKSARSPSGALALRTGDADQLLGLEVVPLQFGVIERPVRGYAKPALHCHRIGM